MSAIYDNWERLVTAVLRKQEEWEFSHCPSRSPSIRSEASDSSASFNSSSRLHDLAFDFSRYGSFSRSWRASSKLVLISDFVPAIDIKKAQAVSPKLLGAGMFGSAYTAAMGNGVRIVVKRLSKSLTISEVDFRRHMDVVGNIRHENVVAVRAYYSSEDERLLLYDYDRKGSVYELLHGKTGESRAQVNWETRLKIAIGAARGIAAIHAQNGGKLVHGNIKATNIFLNSQRYGCVSDLGLTNMIATAFMSTARCYAPEVKNTRDVSQASDVYSFGILLLELLTRKSPMHVPGGHEVVDLVKLVSSIKSKVWAARAFDADLLKNPTIREQMVTMLQIGLRCVAKPIKKRPKMSEVLKILEDLNEINTGKSVSSLEVLFFEVSNATFELEDMLRASAEVLGVGTFGISYKASFDNGNTILIKRLKDVNATHMQFQQHIEVIGRMRHENVAELKAYLLEKELFLVYDYQKQRSLHGPVSVSLDWKTRLDIAVGAARALELFYLNYSGKPATWTAKDGKDILLVDWVQSFRRRGRFSDWSSEVIDFSLEAMRFRDFAGESSALEIAMDCVATIPESRPRMPEVVKILEEISGIKPSNDVWEDTWGGQGQPSIESRLEHLLDHLLPTLPRLNI
ncbi:UNVERIFIED_CONTAM: putative inactive receptor kinase [Sesamum latifolium]|uniref:Inactive receptor kinase n=1 Tax=Sesamum latifolium TaxID=2727402 RepID=A0AAW2T7R4_9LAMI